MKAEKFAEKYRSEYLYSVFKIKNKESKTVKISTQNGFIIWGRSLTDSFSFRDHGDFAVNEVNNPDNPNLLISDVRIPKKDFENWEEMVSKYFPEPNSIDSRSYTAVIDDITLRITNLIGGDEVNYVIKDCFDDMGIGQIQIGRDLAYTITLVSYKLRKLPSK